MGPWLPTRGPAEPRQEYTEGQLGRTPADGRKQVFHEVQGSERDRVPPQVPFEGIRGACGSSSG